MQLSLARLCGGFPWIGYRIGVRCDGGSCAIPTQVRRALWQASASSRRRDGVMLDASSRPSVRRRRLLSDTYWTHSRRSAVRSQVPGEWCRVKGHECTAPTRLATSPRYPVHSVAAFIREGGSGGNRVRATR